MPTRIFTMLFLLTLSILQACASRPAHLDDPQAKFWSHLAALQGQSFAGTIIEDTTASPDFAGKALVMHVARVETDRILVPFHVGDDRSRTWVFTRHDQSLRLKHDHRHADGSEDELTQYGGDTRDSGSSSKQEFYADGHTAQILPPAATNVWTVEIIPGRTYAYALRREGTGRRFRVEFDLTNPIATPPFPWGWK